jgi:hypothetical protein
MRPGHKPRRCEPSRPSKEVSWPSVTAALPRNTGTSITIPVSGNPPVARETADDVPCGA